MCLILEYIPEYPDFPVVLLSDSTPEKAEKLSQALSILVADNNAVVDIHALPFGISRFGIHHFLTWQKPAKYYIILKSFVVRVLSATHLVLHPDSTP